MTDRSQEKHIWAFVKGALTAAKSFSHREKNYKSIYCYCLQCRHLDIEHVWPNPPTHVLKSSILWSVKDCSTASIITICWYHKDIFTPISEVSVAYTRNSIAAVPQTFILHIHTVCVRNSRFAQVVYLALVTVHPSLWIMMSPSSSSFRSKIKSFI